MPLLLLAFRAEAHPLSERLPRVCFNDNVRTIERPLYPDRPKDPSRFSYSFSISQDEANPDAPVVILIPGGPGQTAIDMPSALPTEFPLVRTDPRGVGCNESPDAPIPLDALRSEYIASDILAIVRELKPKRYILHGASYGTLVATIAAARAQAEGLPAPTAVVLEGIIGHAYESGELVQGFIEQWSRFKTLLPKPIADLLLTDQGLPLGFSSAEWGAYLETLLMAGDVPGYGDFALDTLSALDPSRPEREREILSRRINAYFKPESVTSARLRMYREVTCRELDNDVRDQKYDLSLVNGEFVPNPNHFCGDLKLDHPFDAAAYPVTAPIFYFNGGKDPVTPEKQALYHLHSQTQSPRTWVHVPAAGHSTLTSSLSDCGSDLWKAIGGLESKDLKSVLKSCELGSQVLKLDAGAQ